MASAWKQGPIITPVLLMGSPSDKLRRVRVGLRDSPALPDFGKVKVPSLIDLAPLSAIWISSHVNCLFKILAHFFVNWIVRLFHNALDMIPWLIYVILMLCKRLLPLCTLSFNLLLVSFDERKFLILILVHCISLFLYLKWLSLSKNAFWKCLFPQCPPVPLLWYP